MRLPGKSIFSPPKPKSPKPLPPVPTRSDADIQSEANERTRKLRQRKGRAGSILTTEENLGNPVLTRPSAKSTLGG